MSFAHDPLASGFFHIMWYSVLIGIIPSVVMYFWKYIAFLNSKNEESQELALLSSKSIKNDENHVNPIVTIKSSVTSDSLTVRISDSVAVVASGNYIAVHYLSDEELNRHMSRKTISSLEQELPHANFVRCHRSHLVNMDYVLKEEGNAKGLKLTIDHIDKPVQVGRKYVATIRHRLAMKKP